MYDNHQFRGCVLIHNVIAAAGIAAFLMFSPPAAAEQKPGRIIHQHIPSAKPAPGARGGSKSAQQPAMVSRLDRRNVTAFINDVQRVVKEDSKTMTAQDIADYFNNHIADTARFDSTMKYEMPGYPAQESTMSIGKEEYINGVIGGAGLVQSYDHKVEIKDVQISNGGRTAKVKTVINERGEMPWPGEIGPDGRAAQMVAMPVRGQSLCEQTIGISLSSFIQMQKAECYTALSFDPFENTELGADMFFGR